MRAIALALILTAGAAHGADKEKTPAKGGRAPSQRTSEADKPTVICVDPDADCAAHFDAKTYNVFPQVQPAPSEIPMGEMRDALFAKAGISQQDLGGFDEMEKDMLYLHAKHSPLEKLSQRFPRIAQHKLKTLKDLVEKAERKK